MDYLPSFSIAQVVRRNMKPYELFDFGDHLSSDTER